mmetsp:Transcript_118065/g.345785  ORF Transcript_118065/g.345785 Transcript_118065/m.345785 type:complete len:101 (+) Transcript_118065:850-1152(+)
MNMGLALQTAAKATAMNYIQVVFAFLFQLTLLHEASDALSVLGAVMIASWGGVALVKEALRARRAVDVSEERTPESIPNLLRSTPEFSKNYLRKPLASEA